MISALILSYSSTGAASPEATIRSLAVLVPAVIESIIRDVALVGPPGATGAKDLGAIADYAGCALLAAADEGAGLRVGLEAAREDSCLILRAGYVPRHGFLPELAEMLSPGRYRRGVILREERAGLQRILAPRAPVAVLLAAKASLLGLDGADLDDFARRLRPDATFRCGALRVAADH